jgi:uncharacterized protein (TIGR02145 family)
MKNGPAIISALIALLATGLAAQENESATPIGATVTDIDGNVYKTVAIGNQVWMAEDLKTTRYRNGDLIGTTSPATLDISSESSPKYQWAYAGDDSNVANYGRLYTWYAATDCRNIAPTGWHVPTDAEWTTLVNFLGGKSVAQGKLKEAGTTHWNSPNTDATNESGFTAIPGGNRWNNGRFLGIGDFTHWWTATGHDAEFAWRRILVKGAPADNFRGWADKKIGWFVRCIKDAPALPSADLAAQEKPNAAAATQSPASFVCDYLGETPPGDEPQVFGRGVVSVEGKNTHALQFSPDGRMLVFSRYPDKTSFRVVHGKDGWSQPGKTSFTGKEATFDAASKRLFYYDRGGELFWVRYGGDGFSEPTRLNAKINTKEVEYYPCITNRGNLFFSRNANWDQGRIMMAKPAGDDFAEPVDLGDLVNQGGASHGFVVPDESYLLFNSPRAGSTTKNDIWVCFRGADGAWLAPVNLGPRINRDAMAVLCPTVSPDGKYLFFTRLQEGGTGLVYWVSTRVIEKARAPAASDPRM